MAGLLVPPLLQSELNRVASVSREKKGTILFRRGEAGKGVFLVLKGKVDLQLDGKVSVYQTRTLGRGSILGLPATLSGGTYSLGAKVSEDAELGFVSREAFLELLARDSNLCFEAMHILGNEIAAIRSALVSTKAKNRPRA
jgi:CRP-like cAMP-binding protein